MVTVPRSITGSIGSRIRVILGNDGDEWLLLLNYDSGDTKWQNKHWRNIPVAVAKQINNCTSKGRDIKAVDFGADGAWYVNGAKPDGTGCHSWWGGTLASAEIKQWYGMPHELQVSFGSTEWEIETWALIQGKNGYWESSNLNDGLSDRLKRIHDRNKTIHFVRLFSGGQYFISDQEGLSWSLDGEHVANELKERNGGTVRDVAVAGDGSWVVIRDNSFSASKGVDSDLTSALSRFFSEQRKYNNDRSAEIREANATNERERLARERAVQEAREAAEREEREREAREAAEREERLRLQREAAEREERERIRQETERAEREAAAAARLNTASRISSLEAALEARVIEEAKDIKDSEEKLRKRKRSLHATMESMPPETRSRITLDNDKNENDSNQNTCVVCHDEVSIMAVVPCGHLCLCNRCSDVCMSGQSGQQTCPICRGNMQSVLRIYSGN